MGTNFTDIATTDPVVAATINDRLDELDAAIVALPGDTDELVKVGSGGTADYLNDTHFARNATDHVIVSGNIANLFCQGRLTLTTATPIPSSDVTAAITLYFTPYGGNMVALFDGTNWVLYEFTERSISLAGLTANTNYDAFLYDNSGTLTLELVAWSNDTTRATAITLQDGVYVKSGATGRRYLGTIRITGTTGQCEDSKTKRYVWNYYNQVERALTLLNTTSHTYTTASWRAWNNDAANSQVYLVAGEAMRALGIYRSNQTGSGSGFGVGFATNSASAPNGDKTEQFNNLADAASADIFSLQAGYNYFGGIEYGASGPTFERISIVLKVRM